MYGEKFVLYRKVEDVRCMFCGKIMKIIYSSESYYYDCVCGSYTKVPSHKDYFPSHKDNYLIIRDYKDEKTGRNRQSIRKLA